MAQFRTLDLAIEFYQKGKSLKLSNPMNDQYQRALLSIPLNLAEGSAKQSPKERRKFYRIALGSFREVEIILKLSGHVEFLNLVDKLGAHLYRLVTRT